MLKNGHITQNIFDLYKLKLDMERKDKPEFVVINIVDDEYKEFNKKMRKFVNDLGLHNEVYDDPAVMIDKEIIQNYLIYDMLNYYSKQGYLCDACYISGPYIKFYTQFKLSKHKVRNYNKDGKFIHYCKECSPASAGYSCGDDVWYNFRFDI